MPNFFENFIAWIQKLHCFDKQKFENFFSKFSCFPLNRSIWKRGQKSLYCMTSLMDHPLVIAHVNLWNNHLTFLSHALHNNTHVLFQAFQLREWQQLRFRIFRTGQLLKQHDLQSGHAELHPANHATSWPSSFRTTATPPTLANQESQAGAMSSVENLRTGLWKGKKSWTIDE